MESVSKNNMATEEEFMLVQAYSAMSLGLVLLFEGTYVWLKDHVHFSFVGAAMLVVVINWLRLLIKSSRVSRSLPKGRRARMFWLGVYDDEYLKFVEQKATYVAFLTIVFYLVVFWIAEIFDVQRDIYTTALVVDHVMPILGLALIFGALTTVYHLKAGDNE